MPRRRRVEACGKHALNRTDTVHTGVLGLCTPDVLNVLDAGRTKSTECHVRAGNRCYPPPSKSRSLRAVARSREPQQRARCAVDSVHMGELQAMVRHKACKQSVACKMHGRMQFEHARACKNRSHAKWTRACKLGMRTREFGGRACKWRIRPHRMQIGARR